MSRRQTSLRPSQGGKMRGPVGSSLDGELSELEALRLRVRALEAEVQNTPRTARETLEAWASARGLFVHEHQGKFLLALVDNDGRVAMEVSRIILAQGLGSDQLDAIGLIPEDEREPLRSDEFIWPVLRAVLEELPHPDPGRALTKDALIEHIVGHIRRLKRR